MKYTAKEIGLARSWAHHASEQFILDHCDNPKQVVLQRNTATTIDDMLASLLPDYGGGTVGGERGPERIQPYRAEAHYYKGDKALLDGRELTF